MDRTVYFANSDPSDPNRNNTFQKAKVQQALTDLQSMTTLGDNYFSFANIDESALNTSLDPSTSASQSMSFILIWPDDVFNNYLSKVVNGNTPDPNALAVINDANKREFFIIVRASCIPSTTTVTSPCSSLGLPGLEALIDRQMGLIAGMAAKDCRTYPNDIMCATSPSDSQYSTNSQLQFSAAFNNSLESILLNPNYYSK
jgi:hypothetical protein